MKALKTVAVALGITLGALIVIPLAVLAGLFVWLKLTEEADEEILELDQAGANRRGQAHASPIQSRFPLRRIFRRIVATRFLEGSRGFPLMFSAVHRTPKTSGLDTR